MCQTKCLPTTAKEEALTVKGKMGQILECWAQVSDFSGFILQKTKGFGKNNVNSLHVTFPIF